MRRALLVGINDYPSAPLAGCVNDAKKMERVVRRHDDGQVNFDTQLLTSDQQRITRARLREAIENLFADPAEVALLYFSGHGTENNLGGYLVTTDATSYDEGVSLGDVLALVPDEWLEPVPGASAPADLRAAYADFLLARVSGERAWLPVAGAA